MQPDFNRLSIMYANMHDALRLYYELKAKRMWRMLKELGFLAVPAILLFGVLGYATVWELASVPIYDSVLLYVFLLMARHLMRDDSAFLYATFGKRHTKLLYLAEYTLLMMPFQCLFLYRNALWAIAIGVLSLAIACMPCSSFSLRLPTFPCLAYGSYEYHRGGRLTIPVLVLLAAVGAIGAYIGNCNLVTAVGLIAGSVFSFLLMREWYAEYLFNYKSAFRFIQLKLLFALRNACIVFLPFIVCLILVDVSPSALVLGATYYLSASLLLFQVEMLCLVIGGTNGGNDMMSMMAYIFLNAVFYVSLMVTMVLLLSLIVSSVLAYFAYSEIKKYE